MAEQHGKQGVAQMDEARQQHASPGGHSSHGNGHHHHKGGQAAREQGRTTQEGAAEATDRAGAGQNERDQSGTEATQGSEGGAPSATPPMKAKGKRGGTREQHIMAGRKGGQRVRQLIEEGYLWEKEHGIISDDNPFLQRKSEGDQGNGSAREQTAPTEQGEGTDNA
jgi:hypothetical protein